MALHTYSEIPDSQPLKRYFPLNRTLWLMFRHFGWDHVAKGFEAGSQFIGYEVFKSRLNEAINIAQETLLGKLDHPEKIMAFTLFPPGGFIRADLQQGSMKLLYGDSVDVSYIGVRDDTMDASFILNGHLEDGIPVDWWMIGPEDTDILERRHPKYGIKLRDLPKKFRGLENAGWKIRDILYDIRNERTPQWATSTYQIGVGYGSMLHIAYEMSNYEGFGRIFDMIAAKRVYGMPDVGFTYIPMPPLIQMITYLPRSSFVLRSNGFNTNHQFFTAFLEDFVQDFFKEQFPEDWEMVFKRTWEEIGVPWPIQTLNCELPNYKNNKLYEQIGDEGDQFEWKYSPGKFITLEDLYMTLEEAFHGIFYTIDHTHEPGSVNVNESIISTGVGQSTKFPK
ncbi:MAG: hypothetical protein EU536_01145 [Promethearchaeota archaeon]|nr:MAG: hypothetical protein EU536_01145 [Candidatus Lokiarchaeota archaeon]